VFCGIVEMPEIHRSALVPFSCEQIYCVINDVNAYHHFLPNCVSSEVISATENDMSASLTVKKGPIRETFTTRNHLVPFSEINMQLENGPFKSLQGKWLLTPLSEQACKIELKLEFEFSSKLLGKAFSPIFAQLANDMVDSFQKRAKVLFGTGA
jgi:ribosome-associated toxin RatA of RatAB toxin-antitoxin module